MNLVLIIGLLFQSFDLCAAEEAVPARFFFNLRRGAAVETLEAFSEQAGVQLVFLVEELADLRTKRLHGRFSVDEALKRLLSGTGLVGGRDERTDAFIISRRGAPAKHNISRTPQTMKKGTTLRFLAGIFTAAIAAPAINAQHTPIDFDESETIVLPTFTVESETVDRYRSADAVSAVRIRTSLIETPATISVLTREFLEDVAPVRILDATRYSASVQSGYHQTFVDTMTVRGFGVGGRTVDNFFDDVGYLVEPATIERIEISKGPNALLSPGGSPGGHINIVTKTPEFRRKAEISAMVGNWDADKYTIDLTEPLGDSERFAYRLVGVYQDARRYWSKDYERSRKIVSPSFTWRISPTTELLLRYNYTNTAETHSAHTILDSSVVQRGQKPILAPGFSPRSLNGMPKWSVLNYKGATGSVQLTTSFNKYITMRLGAFYQRAGENSDMSLPVLPGLSERYNPYTGILTPDQTWALQNVSLPHDAASNPYIATNSPFYNPNSVQHRGERIITEWRKTYLFQNDWVFSYEVPLAKLQTVTGWAYRDRKRIDQRVGGTMAPYSLYDLENQDTSVVWGNTLVTSFDNKIKNTQLYINQRISVWDERVSATGGYLWYDIDESNISPTHGDSALKDSKGMYMWSLLYRVRPNISLYHSYSTNASPANANGVSMWSEGKQREYGVKTEFFNRRFSLNLAYFEIRQTNITAANPDFRAGDTSAPRDILTNHKNHGVELELNGALTRNLSVTGSFTQLKMRDPYGRHVRFVSENLAALLLSYRFHEGALQGFSFNVGAVYTGEFAGDQPAADTTPLGVVNQPSYFIPSYTLANAGVGYDWGRYQVRLYVDNLEDKKNFIQYGGARYGAEGMFTAAGRNVRLQATLKF